MSEPIEPLGDYTYAEKLALVSKGLMDPKEIGCASAAEAAGLQVMPDAKPGPRLGDYCTFEVSEVPHKLRMFWAKQESKVINVFDEEKWKEENGNTHRLQARLRCGNVATMLDRTYTDVVAGFCDMLTNAGVLLAKMYEKYQENNLITEGTDPLEKPAVKAE